MPAAPNPPRALTSDNHLLAPGSECRRVSRTRPVPILASRMDGNVGLLGSAYPGYFPVGDTRSLATLMQRIEGDRPFACELAQAVRARAPLFAPRREIAAWRRLLREL